MERTQQSKEDTSPSHGLSPWAARKRFCCSSVEGVRGTNPPPPAIIQAAPVRNSPSYRCKATNRIPFCRRDWTHLVKTFVFHFHSETERGCPPPSPGHIPRQTTSCVQLLETCYFSISGAIIAKAEFPNYFEAMIRLFLDDKTPWKSYRDSSLALGQR